MYSRLLLGQSSLQSATSRDFQAQDAPGAGPADAVMQFDKIIRRWWTAAKYERGGSDESRTRWKLVPTSVRGVIILVGVRGFFSQTA